MYVKPQQKEPFRLMTRRTGRSRTYSLLIPILALPFLSLRSIAAEITLDRLVRSGQVILPQDIKPGMRGIGRSVFQGTKIESFQVEVIGVLEKINSGGDVILIRLLDGPVIERNTGIIAGMSGTPIYIEGKLLGALAFGWPFAREPIAGVTPIGDMLRSLDEVSPPAAPGGERHEVALREPITLDGKSFSRVMLRTQGSSRYGMAGGEEFSRAQHGDTIYLEPVQNLLLVNGVRPAALSRLAELFRPYGLMPVIGGGVGNENIDAPLEPGAAVCVQLVRGDIDMSGVGTVTFRQGDQILAFGHPFLGVGELNIPMTNAFVHDIFPSQEMSFKLVSPGKTMGAITQDWAWAIGGRLNLPSPMVPLSIDVRDEKHRLHKSFNIEIANQKDLVAALVLYTAIEATYAAYGLQTEGTVKTELRIECDGLPVIQRENLIYSDGYAVISAVTELAQALSVLTENEFERARIKRVALQCSLEEGRRSAKIKQVFANRSKVKPGEEIEIGVSLEPHGGSPVVKTTTFTVPKDTPAGSLWIGVGSGMSELMLRARLGLHIPYPTNLVELLQLYEQLRSNSDLVVKAALPRFGVSVAGKDMSVLPASIFAVMRSSRSTDIRPVREQISRVIPTDWMLTGFKVLSIRIESEKKAPRIPEPGVSPRAGGGEEREPSEEVEPRTREEPYESTLLPEAVLTSLTRPPRAYLLRFLERLAVDKAPAEEPRQQTEEESEEEEAEEEQTETSREERPSGAPQQAEREQPAGNDKPVGRQPKLWTQSSVKDFLSGTMTNVAVTNKGDVRLAPESEILFRTDELFVWSVATDRSGNAYVGTGNQGRVYRVTREGKSSLIWDSDEVAITSLLSAEDQDSQPLLYAACAPGGTIYRLSPEGKAQLFVRLPVSFIWSLVAGANHDLFCGTGPGGQIYRVKPDGRYELITTLPQDHVRSLALGEEGTLFAGTGDTGVVYRVRVKEKTIEALGNSDGGEVSCLARDEKGNLYFGTAGKAGVYRIAPDGSIKTIYEPPVQAVYALVIDNGNLYVATGDAQKHGILYRMGVAGEDSVNRILETEQAQILSVAYRPGSEGKEQARLFACTGNGGALYALKLPFSNHGIFESSVLDAGSVARWGQIRWQATLPQGTSVSVETRSGNTASPDESWSKWEAANGNSSGAQIISPPGRYFQYRCHLTSNGSQSPLLEQVEVVYLPQNRPPMVTIKRPKGGEYWRGEQSIQWAAEDPDKDQLSYELYLSKDNGAKWESLSLKDPKSTSYSFDTRKQADGIYRLKVIVKDTIGSPADALSAEAISKTFAVDNNPPLLLFSADSFRLDEQKRVTGKAMALDDVSPIVSAEFRIDNGEWRAAVAADGIFDSRWEDIQFVSDAVPEGDHTLEMRVRDAAGNSVTKRERLPAVTK